MARNNSSKDGRPGTGKPLARGSALDKLTPEEANTVLRDLLKNHPELQPEADELARSIVNSPSIEEVADEVFQTISGIELEALGERAGSHS
jgi:hypothetical protein